MHIWMLEIYFKRIYLIDLTSEITDVQLLVGCDNVT